MAGTVVVVDYGVGNIGSILNMFKKLGVRAVGSASADDIAGADRLVLPGVGAFDAAMAKLRETGLIPVLEDTVLSRGTPLLGVCLGAQLLTKGSEEGALPGLGWIDGGVRKFRFNAPVSTLKVPHMGWNDAIPKEGNRLFSGFEETPRFYFVHSYHMVCPEQFVLCESHYGYSFASGIVRENIMGVQFHPEKSHKFGLRLLKNFVELS